MLQRVLVGQRNCPSADLEVRLPRETLEAPLESTASLWSLGREPAPPEAEAAVGSGGRLGPRGRAQSHPDAYLGLQILACLGDIWQVQNLFLCQRKKGSLCWLYICHSPDFHFIYFGKNINK